jgi:hypothetical protein
MTADFPDSTSTAPHLLHEPGDLVWVGQSRGSEREGTVLRYLGESYYSVSVAGQEEPRTVHEQLLHPRGDDE